jgi:lipid II:glycine glycyltransferase (peptidoglycan interpeptide bridge formation enzyme)
MVWTAHLSGRDAEDFDRFVDEAAGGHFAQTRAWEQLAVAGRALSAQYFLVRDEGRVLGAALVLRASVGGVPGPFAQIERGPVCESPSDLPRVLEALVREARRRGVVRLRAMPYWAGDDAKVAEQALRDAGFRDVHEHDSAHALTLRLSIGGRSDDEVLAGSERKSLRYELKHAARVGATSRRGSPEDVRVLEHLHAQLMGSQARSHRPRAYWDALTEIVRAGERGAIFVCEHEARPAGAIFAARHGKLATLVMAASSLEKKTFQKTVLPIMDAIRWARGQGCTEFDFGGIPMPGDSDDKRLAIAKFKLDFSRTKVYLVREHARWF